MLYTLKRRFTRSYSIYAINLECGCPSSPPITHTAFHNVLAANEAAHLLKSLSDDYRALFGPPRVSLRHQAKRVHPNPNHRGCPPVPPTNGCRLGGWHLGHSPCNRCLRPAAAKPSSEWCNNNCNGPSPPPFDCLLTDGDNALRQTCVNRIDALRMIAWRMVSVKETIRYLFHNILIKFSDYFHNIIGKRFRLFLKKNDFYWEMCFLNILY